MRQSLATRRSILLALSFIGAVAPAIVNAQYAGHALRFDGTDDFVSIRNNGDFDFSPRFTVEAWVKPTSLASSSNFRAIVSGTLEDMPDPGLAWGLTLRKEDPSKWGMTVSTPSTRSAFSQPGGLTVGEWQHIAGTYDGTTMRTYRDGVLVASEPHTDPGAPMNPLFVVLGAWGDTFRGYIDEVRIWSTNRSEEKIKTYMHCSLEGDEPNLVGYWRLDEGVGQITADSAGFDSVGRLGSSILQDSKDPVWVVSDAPITCRASESDLFRRGDVNQDSKRDISDAVMTLNFLFVGGVTLSCLDAADSNDDGVINLTDSVMILSLLFTGKVDALPAPFNFCGEDPTRDRLDCDRYDGSCRILLQPVLVE